MSATEIRPSVIAVIECKDNGPCDGGATAVCPHCGAEGRYVYTALMSDGTHKRMMKGCLDSFSRDVCARQCELAVEKKSKRRTSKWDERVINALDGFVCGTVSIETLRSTCKAVAFEKQMYIRNKYRR